MAFLSSETTFCMAVYMCGTGKSDGLTWEWGEMPKITPFPRFAQTVSKKINFVATVTYHFMQKKVKREQLLLRLFTRHWHTKVCDMATWLPPIENLIHITKGCVYTFIFTFLEIRLIFNSIVCTCMYLSGRCMLMALCEDHTQLSSGTFGTCEKTGIQIQNFSRNRTGTT